MTPSSTTRSSTSTSEERAERCVAPSGPPNARCQSRKREGELTSVRFVPLIPNPNTLRNTKRITSETVLLVDLAVRGRLLRIVSSERRAEGGEGEEDVEGRSPDDIGATAVLVLRWRRERGKALRLEGGGKREEGTRLDLEVGGSERACLLWMGEGREGV